MWCNDGSQLEVHLSYDFNDDGWHMLPEAEIIGIRERRKQYKRSRTNRYGGDTRSVSISEITASNTNDVNTVQGQLQII